jgi:hypothetical protein
MGQERNKRLVDSIARDIIAKERLAFLLDGPNKELFLQVGDEEIGRGAGWLYPDDFADTDEVRDAVVTKIATLPLSEVGLILAAGNDPEDTPDEEGCGSELLRHRAAEVIIARMYDLLDHDQQPYVPDYPDPDDR